MEAGLIYETPAKHFVDKNSMCFVEIEAGII